MFAGILSQFFDRTKFNHLQGNKSTIINQTAAGIAVQKGNISSSQHFRGNTEFTVRSNNSTVQINERKFQHQDIRSVLTQIKQTIARKSCSSTLVSE